MNIIEINQKEVANVSGGNFIKNLGNNAALLGSYVTGKENAPDLNYFTGAATVFIPILVVTGTITFSNAAIAGVSLFIVARII